MTHDDRVVYSYKKLISIVMGVDNIDFIDAADYIDCEMMRSIPYQGEFAPVILMDDIAQ